MFTTRQQLSSYEKAFTSEVDKPQLYAVLSSYWQLVLYQMFL